MTEWKVFGEEAVGKASRSQETVAVEDKVVGALAQEHNVA
jgi:hypothetical protein